MGNDISKSSSNEDETRGEPRSAYYSARALAAWKWDAQKFGLQPDELWRSIFTRFNTHSVAIQDDEAFLHDVIETAKEARTADELYDKLKQKRCLRLAELAASFDQTAEELTAYPELLYTSRYSERWQKLRRVEQFLSLDTILPLFASFVTEEHLTRTKDERAKGRDIRRRNAEVRQKRETDSSPKKERDIISLHTLLSEARKDPTDDRDRVPQLQIMKFAVGPDNLQRPGTSSANPIQETYTAPQLSDWAKSPPLGLPSPPVTTERCNSDPPQILHTKVPQSRDDLITKRRTICGTNHPSESTDLGSQQEILLEQSVPGPSSPVASALELSTSTNMPASQQPTLLGSPYVDLHSENPNFLISRAQKRKHEATDSGSIYQRKCCRK